MIFLICSHGEPCEMLLVCVGWPFASPPVPHLPRLRAGDGLEVAPEVGRDRVVGDVGDRARLLAVLDFPERLAAELAVVALLVDRVAAAASMRMPSLMSAIISSGVGDPFRPASRCTFGIRRNGYSRHELACVQPRLALSPMRRRLAVGLSPTRIPSRMIGNFVVFTPSSSYPTVPRPPGMAHRR